MKNIKSWKSLFVAIAALLISQGAMALSSSITNNSSYTINYSYYTYANATCQQAGTCRQLTNSGTVAPGATRPMTTNSAYAGDYDITSPSIVEILRNGDPGDSQGAGTSFGQIWIGGGANLQIINYTPPTCGATTLRWGPSNFCAANVATTAAGASVGMTNTTAGATGGATATCSSGTWSVSGATCAASLAVPPTLNATDGSVAGASTVTWSTVTNASGYDLQYRVQGSGSWTLVTGATSGWQLTTADQSTYEFQVRGKNAAGNGPWSTTETGYIARSCTTQTVTWGASNQCQASATAGAAGTARALNNTVVGFQGTATATCSGTSATWNMSGASCSAFSAPSSIAATDGTVAGKVTVTWGAVAGATGYNLQYRLQGSGTWTAANGVSSGWQLTSANESTYEFQLQATSASGNSPWSVTETGYIARSCTTQTLTWGASNQCQASATAGPAGTARGLNNTVVGFQGTATGTCNGSSAAWDLSGATCANFPAPSTIAATDGAVINAVTVTWTAVPGATGYNLQYRQQGTGTWTAANGVSSGWQLSTTNEAVFEFQLQSTSASGTSVWSATETGFIRPSINPQFVSQSVPANVKVGQSFAVSQSWLNNGSMTWTNALDLGIQSANASFTGVLAKGAASTATGADGIFNATLTAPATPGSYSLQMNWRYNSTTYATSPAATVRVWGDPACSSITASKSLTYTTNDRIQITANVTETTAAPAARAWSVVGGQDDVRTYAVTGAGPYQFEVDLAQHTGFGMVRAQIDLSNPVATFTCSVEFELRQVQPIAVTLSQIYGGDSAARFVIPPGGGQLLSANGARTDSLPMTLTFKDEQGAVLASTPVTTTAATFSANPWLGAAWDSRAYSVEARYNDAGAHAQVGAAVVPATVLIPPTGMQLGAASSSRLPLTVAANVQGAGGSAWTSDLGDWRARLDQTSPEMELVTWGAMASGAMAFEGLNYQALFDKSLRVTAEATPPAGVSLSTPIQITTLLQPQTMPVRYVSATDGTLEEQVRITWEPPFDGMPNVVYDVLRDGQTLQANLGVLTLDDIPAVRGQVYSYTVVARHAGSNSANATDPGNLPACIAPRVESAQVVGQAQEGLGLLAKWLPCVPVNALTTYGFNEAPTKPLSWPSTNGNYRAAVLDITALPNGAHTLNLRSEADGLLGAPREQSFSFEINRAGLLPTEITILHNGQPAQDGVTTNSVGRFGLRMQGGAAQFIVFE